MTSTKKLLSLALTFLIMMGLGSTVFASPNSDVVNAVKNSKVPVEFKQQAENYLLAHPIADADTAKATAIIAEINSANAIIGNSNIGQLSKADTQKIFESVDKAAAVLGLDAKLQTLSTGGYKVSVVDSTGKVVAAATLVKGQVAKTGLDNTLLYVGTALLVMALISTLAIRKRVLN